MLPYLGLNPLNLEAQILLQNALKCLNDKDFDGAHDLLSRAQSISSGAPDILRLLSIVLALKFDFTEALRLIDQVIVMAPDHGVAHSNRGNILKELGQYEEALKSFDRAIKLSPEYAEAYNNKGNLLLEMHLYGDAITCFDRAIELCPDYAEAYSNKGGVYEFMGKYQEALHFFDIATTIKPHYVDAYWNKALTQLSIGDYKNGWENYEARWTKTHPVNFKTFGIDNRLESLENIAGKSVLVWVEQGIGDTFQFCRYIKCLSEKGARVTFFVPESLASSLKGIGRYATFVYNESQIVEKFNFHCPLLSLPLVFGTTIESIPREIPYLEFDLKKSEKFQRQLIEDGALKVGVIWNGGFRVDAPMLWGVNARRNIPLSTIARLQSIFGVAFYSLQKGEPAESELKNVGLSIWPGLINCADELKDFSDTAAIISSLDLIISVDTSVAHLAGALGKPVWILNRYDACWRWLRGRSDSPWYPTARIYQQSSPRGWDEVIERVGKDLACLVKAHQLAYSDR